MGWLQALCSLEAAAAIPPGSPARVRNAAGLIEDFSRACPPDNTGDRIFGPASAA